MTVEHSQAQATAAAYTAAWNTGRSEAVAQFFAPDGCIIINGGTPWEGRALVAEMVGGFLADVPDLSLACDGVRISGQRVVYLWTFTGTHLATRNLLNVVGWEEWELDPSGLISLSRGWFDVESYARQIKAGKTTAPALAIGIAVD